MPHRPPLVILAMDTGDGDAIELWVKQGYLPTIRALMERGCWGRTVGPEMICEYGVGLTMFSGVSRREHGYYYLRQLRPGTYDLESVRAPASAPPFGSHLRGTDARVLVVDVPDAQLVPGLAGLQLTDWGTHHGSKYAPEAEPPELLEDVRRSFGPRIVVHAGPNVSPGEGRKVRASLLERVRRKGALCRELLGRGPFDLAVIFFSDTDAASHSFWKYRPEAAGPAAEDDLRYAIRDVYTAIDAELGKLLERLPSDANVFFLSLYGMQDEYPVSTLIESFLRELGYHAAAGSNGASGGKRALDPLGLARRIVPQGVREAISRRLPERHQEHLLATRLRDTTDWSRTTAFAIPSLFTSFVRVNLRGREPRGIVSPGAEYDAVLGRIADDLALLVDKETGSPAVRRATRTTELFGAGPPSSLPDLFVEWEPGPRMLSTVLHPRATLVQKAPAYCEDSQEKLEGFVVAAGPAVLQSGPIGDIELAPTFMSLLGRPIPASMGGRPLVATLNG
ncbi:hypothetical protein BH18GEM1_BH18GEM1_09000 [soil metagenome]